MGTTAILLIVIGCAGGLDDCREVPVPVPHYASTDVCEQDMNMVIEASANGFDHIFGACAAFDMSLLEVDAEIVWDVTASKGLEIALLPIAEDDEMVIARHTAPLKRSYRN